MTTPPKNLHVLSSEVDDRVEAVVAEQNFKRNSPALWTAF